jgi:hypothetical protein
VDVAARKIAAAIASLFIEVSFVMTQERTSHASVPFEEQDARNFIRMSKMD